LSAEKVRLYYQKPCAHKYEEMNVKGNSLLLSLVSLCSIQPFQQPSIHCGAYTKQRAIF